MNTVHVKSGSKEQAVESLRFERAMRRMREQGQLPNVIWMSPELYADFSRVMSGITDGAMGNAVTTTRRDPDQESAPQPKLQPERVVPCANGCPGRMHPLQDADLLRCDRCGCKMTTAELLHTDPGTRC